MNKILAQGIGKAMRKRVLTDATIGYVNKDLLLRVFLDELNERSTIKTSTSRLRCSEYLWYITYEGKLGMVKKGGMKSNAEKLLRERLIIRDGMGIYRGTKVIDGRGCQCPKHRPIIEAMAGDRWAPQIVKQLCDTLDGGHELQMIIDRNFADAYDPDYDHNVYIDDAVCAYSCMSCRADEAQEFYGGIDGCYVARFLNDDGENIGRCIMYTDGTIRHFIRIYCYEEYMRDCLYTLKHNMKPDDIFGRNECIPGLRLSTNFNSCTPNMYLDGNNYGLIVDGGQLYVGTGYDWDCKETDDGYIGDCWENICECAGCGELMSTEGEDIVDQYDGRHYCSESCARDAGLGQCEECGEWTSDGIETEDGCFYCCASCARNNDYIRTDCWGHWIPRDDEDTITIEGIYHYCCEEEVEADGWRKCADCGAWTRQKYKCQDGAYRCADCLNNSWELMYVKKEVKDEKQTEATEEASAD